MTDSFRANIASFIEETGASALSISAAIEGPLYGLFGAVGEISRTFDKDGRSSSSATIGLGAAAGGDLEGGLTLWFKAPWLEVSVLDDTENTDSAGNTDSWRGTFGFSRENSIAKQIAGGLSLEAGFGLGLGIEFLFSPAGYLGISGTGSVTDFFKIIRILNSRGKIIDQINNRELGDFGSSDVRNALLNIFDNRSLLGSPDAAAFVKLSSTAVGTAALDYFFPGVAIEDGNSDAEAAGEAAIVNIAKARDAAIDRWGANVSVEIYSEGDRGVQIKTNDDVGSWEAKIYVDPDHQNELKTEATYTPHDELLRISEEVSNLANADISSNGDIDGKNNSDLIFTLNDFTSTSGNEANDFIDRIFGNDQQGIIIGGSGNDVLISTNGTPLIEGGLDNDIIFSYGGEGGTLQGGSGRDLIFSSAYGSKIYGDTIDGIGRSESGEEDADVFWYWPGVFIEDAAPNDTLQMFGMPLLGGSNYNGYDALGLPLPVGEGGMAIDRLSPFVYYRLTNTGQLLIYSHLDGRGGFQEGDDLLSRVMVVENFDFGKTEKGLSVPEAGDLGMRFRIYEGSDGSSAISRFTEFYGDISFIAQIYKALAKAVAWQPVQDPLVIDLDGDGIETLSDFRSGIRFDFNGDFFAEKAGWLSGDDGFLVHDADGDGRIVDVSEMFGGPGVSGFAELSDHDDNDDGFITIDDAGFAALQVWRDLDGDAYTDDGELFSLADLGIESIGLDNTEVGSETPQGNTILARGTVTLEDGSTRNAFDMAFSTNATDTVFRGEKGVAEWLRADPLPDAKGFGTIVDLGVAVSSDFEIAEIVRTASEAMTAPDLKAIREAATPIFGAWAQAQELTRELTPVLLDAAGALVDRGIYVEDAAGGYWTLESGGGVRAADGAVIARPTLDAVMAQADGWQLEQMFSPVSRTEDLTHRTETAYLARIVEGRAVIDDYAVEGPAGVWSLASGAPVINAGGTVIAAPVLADILAMPAPEGAEWRVESFGTNPYGDLPVESMGVQVIDGTVVDYSVAITDADGVFHVWARNLDRALELQHRTGEAGNFLLRNYEIDFDTLDTVGSTDDSVYRVEILTAGQLHFASSLYGIDFQPQIMSAQTSPETQLLSYSVGSFQGEEAPTTDEEGGYASTIDPAIELFDGMFQSYVTASRALSVRIALQGGLAEFSRRLSYDAPSDRYEATTDREMAPMFEAIFEGAPEGAEAAYDYLVAWDEILEVVYPDYHVDGEVNFVTGRMRLDQQFVFQMVLSAFETVGIDADLPAVLNALGVDEEKLIAHAAGDTEVNGTAGQDFVYLSTGDQTYDGGFGSDVYFVGQDFGSDTITDIEYRYVEGGDPGADVLRFSHAKSTDIFATRDGLDLVLEVIGTDDVLRVTQQFEGEQIDPVFGKDFSPDTGVTNIVFADGVIWDAFAIAAAVNHPLDTDDLVLGSQARDVLEGGLGNDVLRGGRDGDVYIFREGDGQDRIDDDNDMPTDDPASKFDIIQVQASFDAENIRFIRVGDSGDVTMEILGEDGEPTGDSITIEGQFDWTSIPGLGLLFPDTIERVAFGNGTFLVETDIMARVLAAAKTDDDDLIYGFNNADTLDGGLGNDVLIGRAQNDTYLFGRGDGHDVIEDGDNDFFNESFDRLELRDDLRWTDFTFEREGDSATVTLAVTGTDDAVTLRNAFASEQLLGFTNLIEEIVFGDGTVWDYAKLAQHVVDLSVTAGDDTVYGFEIADSMDGGAGDDLLVGGYGSDSYVFARGYGDDVIDDIGSGSRGDSLTLRDIASTDVAFERAGDDLILVIRDTGESVTLRDQYVRTSGDPVRGEPQYKAIETFVFSDTTVDWRDLNPEDVDHVGTNAGETLIGTAFGETIDGQAGDDTLIGGSDGDTYLFDVGYGDDTIIDRQERTAWYDRTREGIQKVAEGDDTILFGADITVDNAVYTKDGNDLLISVLERTDTLRIQNQFRSIEDAVEWFEYADGTRLHISDIEERLAIVGGSRGDDVIEGTPDSPNVLDGRQGDDELIGGRQGDTYAFGTAYDLDGIIESDNPASGVVDRVVFSASVTPDAVDLIRDGDDLIIDLGNGTDRLTIREGLTTRQVEEFLFADGTAWTLEQVRDRLLTGSDSDDMLRGFNDREDVLDGGKGSDALEGGLGDDTYRFEIGSGQDAVTDTGGIDEIVFGAGISAATVDFSREGDDLLIRLTDSESDSLIVHGGAARLGSASLVERLVFEDGTRVAIADVLVRLVDVQSTNGGDVIDARTGQSLAVDAGTGDDLILGEAGGVFVFDAGDGYDIVDTTGERGTSRILFREAGSADARFRRADLDSDDIIVAFPQTGDQVLIRGALSDTNVSSIAFADGVELDRAAFIAAAVAAQASDAGDAITGSSDDDRIEGGLGNDDIEGGAGDDTYVFTRGDGRDVITDARGTDRLEIQGYRAEDVSVTKPVSDRDELILTFADSADEIVLNLAGTRGIDIVSFGDGTEWTRTQLLDTAVGMGTAFDDVLIGNASDNTLDGGTGYDLLQGGTSDDTYIFGQGYGQDIISDTSGTNRIIMRDYGVAQASALRFDDRQNDLVLRFADGDELIVPFYFNRTTANIAEILFEDGVVWTRTDVLLALETARDPAADESIIGTTGNDTLVGNEGDDVLSGGIGNDRYIFTRGDGRDVIEDNGRGTDTIELRGYGRDDLILSNRVNAPDTLIIRFDGTDDEIVLVNALLTTSADKIESIVFTNGDASFDTAALRKLVVENGSEGNDRLLGTTAMDTLDGGSGDDYLRGNGSNDLYVFARGGGNDVIEDDSNTNGDALRIEGYTRADIRFSRDPNAVNDLIVTFNNSDDSIRIIGTLGSVGANRIEEIRFGDGSDAFTLADIRDIMLTDAATSGDDRILGLPFETTLAGGAGNDWLSGRSGSDTYLFAQGDGHDIIDDNGGNSSRADSIRITGYTSSDLSFAPDTDVIDALLITFAGSDDKITITNALSNQTSDRIETIEFTNGVDDPLDLTGIIAGLTVRDTIEGTTGADTFVSTEADEIFSGLRSNDAYVYRVGGGKDIIKDGSGGTDTIRIEGYALTDAIFTQSRAYAYDLVIRFEGSDDQIVVVGGLQGGNGNAILAQIEKFEFYDITSGTPVLTDSLLDTDVFQRILDDRNLTSDNARIVGNNDANILHSGSGDNVIYGGAGNDTYVFGAGDGHDTVIEGGQSDTDRILIEGYGRDDLIFAREAGNGGTLLITFVESDDSLRIPNTLNGIHYNIEEVAFANGDDSYSLADIGTILAAVDATDGDDQVRGNGGGNVLGGGIGNDRLQGGDGSDTYIFARGDGVDSIHDGGDRDNDRILITGYEPGEVSLRIGHYPSNTLVLEFAGTDDRLIVENTLVDNYPDGIEEIVFASGERWTMDDVRARLAFEQATDGNDVITGFDSAETFDGGAGNDLIDGGSGNDTYIYTRGDGFDVIIDDNRDTGDVLRLEGIDPTSVRLRNGIGDDLAIEILPSAEDEGDGGRITVRDGYPSNAREGVDSIIFDDGTIWWRSNFETLALRNLATNGDDRLTGTTGNDTLEGGTGDDALSGLAGDDLYRFAAGDGAETIRDAGGGFDRIEVNGYTLADTSFERRGREGEDLILRLGINGDSITIINGLARRTADQIEEITFSDTGETLSLAEMRAALVIGDPSDNDDQIIGSVEDDVLRGGAGDDLLTGGEGNDVYEYAAGDEDDRISDGGQTSGDILRLTDYGLADLTSVTRSPANGADLVLRFGEDTRDRITIAGTLLGDAGGVEAIEFADGAVWTLAEMRSAVLEFANSDEGIGIRGFASDDVLEGGQGDDWLSGGEGADLYVYNSGDGSDVFEDGSTSADDRLELVDILSAEASVARLYRGSDSIVLSLAGRDDRLVLRDALAEDGSGIEEIAFGDGVVWTRETLLTLLDNNAPVAVGDGIIAAREGEPVTIAAIDLLRNDFDADGDTLSIIAVDGGENGTAEIDADGNIVFTAASGFTGSTTFTYSVIDGQGGAATGTVDMRVNPLASALDDDGFTVEEDGFLTIETLRLLSNDVDGDRLILSQVFDAQHGTVSLSSNGEIGFTPDANYNGPASFRYVANTPEGGRAEATVSINVESVNDAPLAVDDSGFVTDEDIAFIIDPTTLLANDSDIDGDALTIESVLSTASLSVELTFDGQIRVTPTPYFFGEATFSYTVSDGEGGTTTANVTVSVAPVNNAPELEIDSFTTDEDAPILISVADLLLNDIDRDFDILTVTSVRRASGGTVELFDNGEIAFTPGANVNGEAYFFYTVDDGQGGVTEGRVNIQIDPVNDAPTARDERYDDNSVFFLNGTEDVPLTISITDLLANDTDIDGLSLTPASVSFAENGTVVLNEDGTITFTPDADYWGEASFSYVVRDEGGLVDDARVTMYFEPVGDAPPVAGDDTVTLYEDVPLVIKAATLLANDTDIDRDVLRITDVRMQGLSTGSVTLNEDGDIVYTPGLNQTIGVDFEYTVTDDADGTDTGTVDVSIIAVNDAPTADPDAGATSLDVPLVLRVTDLMANDFDVDISSLIYPNPLDYLTFAGLVSTANGTGSVYGGGEFIVVDYGPAYSGTTSLEYAVADDDGVTDNGTVSIDISADIRTLLEGGADRDLIIGSQRSETIAGREGDDDLFGRDGDDLLDGGDGADSIDGGDGYDTITFAGSNIGVRADLAARIGQGGFAQGDIYTNIEALLGTRYSDELGGDATNNTLDGADGRDLLIGREGDDVLIGAAGDDTLDGGTGGDLLSGGAGSDTATYQTSTAAVSVSLADGTATGGDATGDVLDSIENLTGTDFADTLTGDDAANVLQGGRGDDTLDGGAGDDVLRGGRGADTMIGGAGFDRVDYSTSASGVTVDLLDASAGGGDAEGDVLDGIELITGSFHNDTLRGDDADNRFMGGRGADSIDGGAGFDIADYSEADEAIALDLTTGLGSAGEAAGDQLTNIEMVIGSEYADSITGSTGNDVFEGGFGDDTLDGAGGSDTYSFGYDSGADIVIETGAITDADVVEIDAGIEPKDISLVIDGDDLLIELERDDGFGIDTMRIADHFLGTASGIEIIRFDDGTEWDRAAIDTLTRVGRFNAADDVVRFVDEDVPFTINLATLTLNDATEGANALEIVSVSDFENGSGQVLADGNIEFTGAQDFNGDAFFRYTVRDAFGRESSARVEVNVRAVNDAPIAVPDGVIAGVEDEILFIDPAVLLANDTDIDGDTLSLTGNFRAVTGADGQPLGDQLYGTNGGASLQVTGLGTQSVVFVPDADHFGYAGFEYEVRDPDGLTSWAAVELDLAAVNDAPKTELDRFENRLGIVNSIAVADLLANDIDVEGDDFDLTDIVEVRNGTATIRTDVDGVRWIDVEHDTLGDATLRYEATDSFGASSIGLVEFTVIPLNDPPMARDDSGFETVEDAVIIIDPATLLVNDTDADGDILTISGFERFPLNGKVTFTETGMIAFTPRRDYNGEAGFEYIVTDGQDTDTGFVAINVLPDNDAPVLRDDVLAGLEDLPVTIIAAEAFANDMDPEGDVIFFEDASILGVVSDDFSGRDPVATGFAADLAGVPVTATLGDGSALPDWLTFDADALTFTGTPPEGAGALDVALAFTHTDAEGVVSTFEDGMTIDPADPALTSGLAYAPSMMAVDTGTDWTASADLWTGRELPAWLAFDAQTMTFSQTGITPDADESIARVWVSLTPDGAEEPAVSIEVRIDPFAPIDPAINALFDVPDFFSAQGLFALPVSDAATPTADHAYRTGLPDWLEFDAATLSFTGAAPNEYVGAISTRVDIAASSDTPAFALIRDIVVDDDIEVIDINDLNLDAAGAFRLSVTDEGITVFRPEDFNGSLAIEYTARDTYDAVSTAPATIVLNIAPQRELPDALTDEVTVNEDASVDISLASLLANDRDDDGDPIWISAIAAPDTGALSLRLADGTVLDAPTPLTDAQNAGAVLTYTPPPEFSGPVVFTYMLEDGQEGASEGRVEIEVAPLNDAPVAVDDRANGFEDTPLTIDAAQLLANDSDVDGDTLRVESVTNAINGTVTLNGGQIVFTPDYNFDGAASFDYVVTDDNNGSTAATVDVQITSTNQRPETVIDRLFGFEDTAFIVSPDDLMANDIDPDGDALRFLEILPTAENGIAVQRPDGTYALTPRENFNGEIAFTYTITDERLDSVETGNIIVTFAAVNDDPVAGADGGFVTAEDTAITIDPASLLLNDTDVEGDALTFDGVLDPVNGTVAVIGGRIVFTPRPDYFGNGGFSYRVIDGNGGVGIGTVSLTVTPENDLPYALTDIGGTIDEDGFLDIDPADLLANDGDPDNDDISFVRPLGANVQMLANGMIRYTPGTDDNGQLGFSYEITDGELFATGEVLVDVRPVDDAPFARDDRVNGIEDTSLTIPLRDLTSNDYDVDGHGFQITDVSNGTGGTVALDGAGNVIFTPNADLAGAASFDYTVTDTTGETDTATVRITLAEVNDAPRINALDPILGTEDMRLVAALPSDVIVDPDGDALTITARQADGSSLPDWLVFRGDLLAFVGTPPQDFNGTIAVEIVASDGLLETVRAVDVVIVPTPDAPILGTLSDVTVGEDMPVNIVLPDDFATDPDGDALTLSAQLVDGTALPVWLAFDGTGFTGTPPQDFTGILSVEIMASDGVLGTTTRFDLIIAPVNDAPVLADLPNVMVDEDTVVDIVLPDGFASDPDGDALTLSARMADGSTLPDWLAFDGIRLTGTPPQDFNGTFSVELAASDGRIETTTAFDLTIAPINDAPVLGSLPNITADEDMPVDIVLPAGLASDVDGDALTFNARQADGTALPGWLSFDGARLTGTPPKDFNGILTIEISADDGALNAATTFDLIIAPINDAPVLATLADITVDEDAIVDIVLPDGFAEDPDGDTLALSARLADGTALPEWLAFDDVRLTGTPPQNFNGTLAVEIVANDGAFETSTAFDLIVAPVNDAPVIGGLPDASIAEDAPIDIALPDGFANDVDGDALTLSARLADGSALPDWLTFDGTRFTGTPPQDYNGTLAVVVTASDGALDSVATFNIIVTPAPDAPTLGTLSDVSVAEDTAVDIALPDGFARDADGDTLALSARLADGSALPAWLVFDGARLIGTPPQDFNGILTIEIVASDGTLESTAIFDLAITPVNDAPMAGVASPVSVTEDTPFTAVLDAGLFSDVDGDALSFTLEMADGSAAPAWIGYDAGFNALVGTPPTDFTGNLTLRLIANDGEASASTMVEFEVVNVNDAPKLDALPVVHTDEDTAIDIVLPTDFANDVDGDALTLTAQRAGGGTLPDWLVFDAAARRFTGTPPANLNGILALEIIANDGAAQTATIFDLVIDPINDAPTLSGPLSDRFVDEETPFDIALQGDLFSDVDGDTLAFTASLSDGTDLPSWLSFNPDDISLSGQAPAGFSGDLSLTVTASDGTESVSDTFDFGVRFINDAPEVGDDAVTVSDDDLTRIDAATLLANDSDPEGEDLSIIAVEQTGAGSVALNTDGSVTYTPTAGFVGEDSFAYITSDGTNSSRGVVAVTVESTLDNVDEQGTTGNDRITGDSFGDSTVDAGAGDDRVNTGFGNDVVAGGQGNDRINTGFGNDSIFGGSGNDRVNAGFGNDYLNLGSGNDRANGGFGNDLLFGGSGSDRLDGGLGSDTIDGGTGDDILRGGLGSDLFRFGEGYGSDTIRDYQTTRSFRRFSIEGDRIEIDIDGVASFDDLLPYGQDRRGGVLFDFGDGDELFLRGTQLASLDRDSFTFA